MSRDLTNHPAFNQPQKEPFLKSGDWPELPPESCSKMEWSEWKETLDILGEYFEWDTQSSEWREYYDNGCSPLEAIKGDMRDDIY